MNKQEFVDRLRMALNGRVSPGLELVEVHDCIWLEAGMLADTHAAPVGVMIFLEHQKRLFRDKGKIDSWDLLVEKTAV